MQNKRERVICFDLIRLFSCLCVTIVHFNASISAYNGTFVYPNSLVPNFYLGGRTYLGSIGVSLFFMLSGAAQMLTYREGDLPGFYRKRFMSLFPMFWIAYVIASVGDFLFYKGMARGNALQLLYSAVGEDGYMSLLGFISFDYYKLGEWFLGCILLLFIIFPLLHLGVKKAPVVTVTAALAIYVFFEIHPRIGRYAIGGSEFFLRIPEMLFGMFFTKHRLWEGKKPFWLMGATACALALAWVFREHLSSLTMTVALCLALFSLMVLLGRLIRGEGVKARMASLSVLTYPIFLTHHWLIDKMVLGFNLADMPRAYVIMMFIAYLLITLFASWLLQRAGKWFSGLGLFTNRVSSAVLWTLVFAGIIVLPATAVVHYALAEPVPAEVASASEDAYDAVISGQDTPAVVVRGEAFDVAVTVSNTGDSPWTESEHIRLSVWLNGEDWRRCYLPADAVVSPGEDYTFHIPDLTFEDVGGSVSLEYQMVKETVRYFGEKARSDVQIVETHG